MEIPQPRQLVACPSEPPSRVTRASYACRGISNVRGYPGKLAYSRKAQEPSVDARAPRSTHPPAIRFRRRPGGGSRKRDRTPVSYCVAAKASCRPRVLGSGSPSRRSRERDQSLVRIHPDGVRGPSRAHPAPLPDAIALILLRPPGSRCRSVRSPGSMPAHPPRSVFAFDLKPLYIPLIRRRHLMLPSAPSDGIAGHSCLARHHAGSTLDAGFFR